MLLEIILPVARLFLLTLAGYIVFKIPVIERYLLKPAVFVIVNIVFPLFFVHTLPSQWSEGLAAGWIWLVVFFVAYLVMLGAQVGLAKLLINRVPLLHTNHPKELLVLFAMHNAGYIPIPIIAALAPPAVSVYMAGYVMVFIVLFFTVAVWIIQGARGADHARPGFKIHPPVVGIVLGLLLAVTGLYERVPEWVKLPFVWSSAIATDAIMVVLGAILASVSKGGFRFRREYAGFVLVKMIAYPLVVVGVMALIPFGGVRPDVAAGIRLALILEAVVPPATNILVVTKAYGTSEQLEYAGSAILFTYAAGLVLMPAFLILSRVLFG